MLEHLEVRVLLAASLSNGVLLVNTGSASDHIVISLKGSQLNVLKGGVFEAAKVRKIVVNAGAGNDRIELRNINLPSTLNGGAGNDIINGGDSNDRIYGGPGNDQLYGKSGHDMLDGGTGRNIVDGGKGTDTVSYASRSGGVTVRLDGTAGTVQPGTVDQVRTTVENIIGSPGSDLLVGGPGTNYIRGLGGNDTIRATGANDTLDGGEGDDVLVVGASAVELIGGLGRDTADFSARTMDLSLTLDGVANDGAAGEASNVRPDVENVLGGTGNDRITGSAADNRLAGGAGDDTLNGGAGGDTLEGGEGRDVADYSDRAEDLSLSLDEVANDGATGEKDLIGTGIEEVRGGAGNDRLIGNGDNSLLNGGAGDDTLDGGLGDDTLIGGAGRDAADYSSRTEALIINLSGEDNRGGPDEHDRIDTTIEVVVGGLANDWIEGNGSANCLVGGPGDDTLMGWGGNDTLDGGAGADSLMGGDGLDTADYSSRSEALSISLDEVANDGQIGEVDNVRNDIETIVGGVGNDSITGSDAADRLLGGRGRDTLSGLGGDDTLDGGEGLYGDQLFGGDGDDTADYSYRVEDLSINIDGFNNDGQVGEGDNVSTDIETVISGSGDDRLTAVSVTGGKGSHLFGGTGNDTLLGRGGNDTLEGGWGGDEIVGGLGFDTVDYSYRTANLTIIMDDVANDGEAGEGDYVGTDVEGVLCGSGNDFVSGNIRDNYLVGNAGNDSLEGNGGDDTLDGGTGRDTLSGGGGNDTADYSSRTADLSIALDGFEGDGETGERDWIQADIENAWGGSGNDFIHGNDEGNILRGGAGNDTIFAFGGNDIVMPGDGTDSVSGGVGDQDAVDYSDKTNGVSITLDGVANDGEAGENDSIADDFELAVGGAGNDTLVGNDNANILKGGAGNDSISGGAGNDTLSGGAGADTLAGGAGTDTADYSDRTNAVNVSLDGVANDGEANENDLLDAEIENVTGGAGNDTLVGGEGANILKGGAGNDSISGGAGNDTLIGGTGADTLTGGGGSDTADYSDRTNALTITLDGQANDGEAGENDLIDIDVENVLGGSGNDSITGDGAGNLLSGGIGYDTIHGGGGDDILDGGLGDDKLYGEEGNDVVHGGEGGDTLDGGMGNDQFLGEGGDDLLVGGDTLDGADSFEGGDGLDTLDYEMRTAALTISIDGVANDGETGEKDNVKSVDIVLGGLGNDTITGSVNADSLSGGGGNDSIVGGGGDDVITGGAGLNTLAGGEGNDTILGGGDEESISGDAGDDSLDGSDGNDTISGGEGADILLGGNGDDTINSNVAGTNDDGAIDLIRDFAGNNTIARSTEDPDFIV